MKHDEAPASARGQRFSRNAWIANALKLIGTGGPDAVRLEALCAALGVTKGSFYWHFKSRADFLAAAFAAWEERETEAIIATVETHGGTPREKIETLFGEAMSGRVDFGVELAIRHWARLNAVAALSVKRVDARRADYLEQLLRQDGKSAADARIRASAIYDLILGEALAIRSEHVSARARRRDSLLRLVLD